MNIKTPPAIRFAIKEYRVYINWAVLIILNKPAYLQFLFNDEHKLLAVSGSIEPKENSYIIPDRTYRCDDLECNISRKALTEAFRVRMNWDKSKNYRVIGEYDKNIDMVVFDLTTAAVVRTEG